MFKKQGINFPIHVSSGVNVTWCGWPLGLKPQGLHFPLHLGLTKEGRQEDDPVNLHEEAILDMALKPVSLSWPSTWMKTEGQNQRSFPGASSHPLCICLSSLLPGRRSTDKLFMPRHHQTLKER